jgi:hypothetical protein
VKLKGALGATAGVHRQDREEFGRPTRLASLSVGSRRLTKALLALGVTPRKSATIEPWNGAADLMSHYWRGLFDGDGSLARKTEGLWTVFFCGSEACVRGFTAWAHASLPLDAPRGCKACETPWPAHPRRSGGHWQLRACTAG